MKTTDWIREKQIIRLVIKANFKLICAVWVITIGYHSAEKGINCIDVTQPLKALKIHILITFLL